MWRITKVATALCCLVMMAAVGAQAAYDVTYLGSLAGGESWALGINNKGAVVGCSIDKNGHQRAFLWNSKDGMSDLGTLGGDNAAAMSVDDDGEVVGYSEIAGGARHAFIVTIEGGLTDLDVLPGDAASEAAFVRDFLVGWSKNDSGRLRAFSWNVDMGLTALAELSPGADTQAFGVNKQGVAVGAAKDAKGVMRAVIWRPDGTISMQDTGVLGGAGSVALAINDSGVVVGEAKDELGQVHAFCGVPSSSLNRLPLPRDTSGARATCINNSNQVAGWVLGDRKRAVVWDLGPELTSEITVKMPTLPLLPGTVASEATAIGEDGTVVGFCVTPKNEKRAVIWRPGKKEVGPAIAFVAGVFVPTNSSTRDDFESTWLRVALTPFERERRTRPHFCIESGALRFNGPTDVELYEISAGVEKGLKPSAHAQPYIALRAGPYYGKISEDATGDEETKWGLNINASYGIIYNRNIYTELRYDYFSRFAGYDFSGVSLSVGFRLFDLPR